MPYISREKKKHSCRGLSVDRGEYAKPYRHGNNRFYYRYAKAALISEPQLSAVL